MRNKIISEETFLKNYFDINNLLIMSKENGFEIENNYKFKDLTLLPLPVHGPAFKYGYANIETPPFTRSKD